jgi:hypothetical protein
VVIRVYEKLRSAVSVEMYGASSVPVLAKLEDPKVAVLRDGHFAYTLLLQLLDDAGNVIETHQHKGEFKEPW